MNWGRILWIEGWGFPISSECCTQCNVCAAEGLPPGDVCYIMVRDRCRLADYPTNRYTPLL